MWGKRGSPGTRPHMDTEGKDVACERLFCVCSDGKEGLGTPSQSLCQGWQGRPPLHWVLLPGHAVPPGNWGWGEGSWGFPRDVTLGRC